MAVSTEETRGWRSATVTKLSLWFNPWWPLRHRADVKERTTSIEIATCVAAFKDASKRATSPDHRGLNAAWEPTRPSRSSPSDLELFVLKILSRRFRFVVLHTPLSRLFREIYEYTYVYVCVYRLDTFDTLSTTRKRIRNVGDECNEIRWNGTLKKLRRRGRCNFPLSDYSLY